MELAAVKVVVLGAGIQGVCAALALRKIASSIMLIDKGSDCMQFASRVNEGKIHLGHVYANDATFRTTSRMLESAMKFGPLIESWIDEPVDWRALRSNPFTYVVARDSMVPPADLMQHYERLNDSYRALVSDNPQLHYLGTRPNAMWSVAPMASELSTTFGQLAVETPEASVDLNKFQEIMSAAIGDSHEITTLYGHHIDSVERTKGGFLIEGSQSDGSAWEQTADVAVNCLWESRLTIDEQMGVLANRSWLYRLKYRLLVDLPRELRDLASFTFVLGPYGDIVTYPESDLVYLSWYPCCMYDSSSMVAPPPSWANHFEGADHKAAEMVASTSLEALDVIVPGIENSRVHAVNAGAIFSWGDTDIIDDDSELHTRHDIGVEEHDGYFSINTGKFTSAPLFAHHLVELLDKAP